MEQISLLTDLEFTPVLASTGKRFLNLLIDLIFIYIFAVVVGVLLVLSRNAVSYSSDDSYGSLFYRFVGYLIYLTYYLICEIAFKGRTIAKFITGTRAVNEDGTEMLPKTVLLRSLSRIVPFEPFSAFGIRPWHDKWTNTYVIDVKKTSLSVSAY
ncbi:MAG TPA: RDD family protein [Parafilimonas sp.]|nr:RDD family protein [Parafilimonas sp.]